MSNFDIALQTVFKHEGLFVNDKDDPGGATKYGVSLRWLKSIGDTNSDGQLDGDFDADGDVDVHDIQHMTKDQARQLYLEQWWKKYHYERICDQKLATKVFDLSVNMGSKQAHKCIQRAIRAAGHQLLVDDGILGEQSFSAINDADAEQLLVGLKCEAAGFYRSLNKPKYLQGWLNRAYS